MEKIWSEKVDDLVGLYQARLKQLQAQLDEALRQKLISKSVYRERAKIVAQLSQTLIHQQHSRSLLGAGGKLRIDIGLPPLAVLQSKEAPLVANYLKARGQAVSALMPIIKKISSWVNEGDSRWFSGLKSTLRLSAMREMSTGLDKRQKQIGREMEKADDELLARCNEIGRQPIHRNLGGDQMAILLQDLESAAGRIQQAEEHLEKTVMELAGKEKQVRHALEQLALPIPDLGMPELLAFVMETDPLLETTQAFAFNGEENGGFSHLEGNDNWEESLLK